jgi:hypothetical protein
VRRRSGSVVPVECDHEIHRALSHLPWTRWGDEFAAAMPEEIRRLQEHAATTDGTPRQDVSPFPKRAQRGLCEATRAGPLAWWFAPAARVGGLPFWCE